MALESRKLLKKRALKREKGLRRDAQSDEDDMHNEDAQGAVQEAHKKKGKKKRLKVRDDEEKAPSEEAAPVVQNTPTESTALVPVVAGVDAPTPSGDQEWQWTKKKRLALRLTLDGFPIVKIAEQTAKHRNTIRNWWMAAPFQAEVRKRLQEKATAMRMRHMTRVAYISEAMYQKQRKLLDEALKNDGKLDVGQSQMLLREILNWQREERELMEGSQQKAAGGPVVNVNVFGGQGAEGGDVQRSSVVNESFHKLLKDHVPNINAYKADTAQDALINATVTALQKSDVLNKIAEEDKITARERAEAEAAGKRKR